MLKRFPQEFRDNVIRVARDRDPEVSISQIATDFGISESCIHRWLKIADIDAGHKPGTTTGEQTENRELRRPVKLLEQENEVLHRAAAYLGQANLPKG